MQVIDLHFYLKCHSSTGVFQIFCYWKSTTWFVHKWNFGQKWINKTLKTSYQRWYMYVIRKYIWFFFWIRLKIFMLLVLLHSRKSGCNKEAINIFYKKLLISSRIKTKIASILENRQSPFNRNFISKNVSPKPGCLF